MSSIGVLVGEDKTIVVTLSLILVRLFKNPTLNLPYPHESYCFQTEHTFDRH